MMSEKKISVDSSSSEKTGSSGPSEQSASGLPVLPADARLVHLSPELILTLTKIAEETADVVYLRDQLSEMLGWDSFRRTQSPSPRGCDVEDNRIAGLLMKFSDLRVQDFFDLAVTNDYVLQTLLTAKERLKSSKWLVKPMHPELEPYDAAFTAGLEKDPNLWKKYRPRSVIEKESELVLKRRNELIDRTVWLKSYNQNFARWSKIEEEFRRRGSILSTNERELPPVTGFARIFQWMWVSLMSIANSSYAFISRRRDSQAHSPSTENESIQLSVIPRSDEGEAGTSTRVETLAVGSAGPSERRPLIALSKNRNTSGSTDTANLIARADWPVPIGFKAVWEVITYVYDDTADVERYQEQNDLTNRSRKTTKLGTTRSEARIKSWESGWPTGGSRNIEVFLVNAQDDGDPVKYTVRSETALEADPDKERNPGGFVEFLEGNVSVISSRMYEKGTGRVLREVIMYVPQKCQMENAKQLLVVERSPTKNKQYRGLTVFREADEYCDVVYAGARDWFREDKPGGFFPQPEELSTWAKRCVAMAVDRMKFWEDAFHGSQVAFFHREIQLSLRCLVSPYETTLTRGYSKYILVVHYEPPAPRSYEQERMRKFYKELECDLKAYAFQDEDKKFIFDSDYLFPNSTLCPKLIRNIFNNAETVLFVFTPDSFKKFAVVREDFPDTLHYLYALSDYEYRRKPNRCVQRICSVSLGDKEEDVQLWKPIMPDWAWHGDYRQHHYGLKSIDGVKMHIRLFESLFDKKVLASRETAAHLGKRLGLPYPKEILEKCSDCNSF